MKQLKFLLAHPVFKLLISLILVITSWFEIYNMAEHSFSNIGAHHGIAIYGIVMLLNSIAELLSYSTEAFESLESAKRI